MSLTNEAVINQNTLDNVIDVDLSVIQKKRFRINNDNNKILELNTSDLHVITRLEEAYPKLEKLSNDVIQLNFDDDGNPKNSDDDSEEVFAKDVALLKKIDDDMREFVDYIFDSNVSEICASDGSMYDPFNGKFRFEHIIDKLMGLYESNINEQFKRFESSTVKHAAKYTKKRKK